MNHSTVPALTLNSGMTMAQFGLCVWDAVEGPKVETAVRDT